MAISPRDLAKVRVGDVLLHFGEEVKLTTDKKGKQVAIRHRFIKPAQVVSIHYQRGRISYFTIRWGRGKRGKEERASAGDVRALFRRHAPEWMRKGRGKDASFECYHCGAIVENMKARKLLERGAGHSPTCEHPRARRYRMQRAQLRLF